MNYCFENKLSVKNGKYLTSAFTPLKLRFLNSKLKNPAKLLAPFFILFPFQNLRSPQPSALPWNFYHSHFFKIIFFILLFLFKSSGHLLSPSMDWTLDGCSLRISQFWTLSLELNHWNRAFGLFSALQQNFHIFLFFSLELKLPIGVQIEQFAANKSNVYEVSWLF